jgi:hypothetical protein
MGIIAGSLALYLDIAEGRREFFCALGDHQASRK